MSHSKDRRVEYSGDLPDGSGRERWGSDSVVLAAPPVTVWTATANADWLHVTTASGAGNVYTADQFAEGNLSDAKMAMDELQKNALKQAGDASNPMKYKMEAAEQSH